MVGTRLAVAVVVFNLDIEGLLVVRSRLLVLSQRLRHPPQLVVGTRLAVAVVVFNLDIEGLLVVRSRLLVLSQLFYHPPQLVVVGGYC